MQNIFFQLSLLGATLEKISIEIRNLQRTEIGEVSEYFQKRSNGQQCSSCQKKSNKK